MIKKLKEHSSYYTTTEEEANTLIKNIKDQTGGDIAVSYTHLTLPTILLV